MLRRAVREKKTGRRMRRVAYLLLFVVAVTSMRAGLPTLPALTEQAALLSAMVNMPEGTLSMLEQRFAGALAPSYDPSGSEREVLPYLSPWEEQPPAPPPADPSVQSPATQLAQRPAVSKDAAPSPENPGRVPQAHLGTNLQENLAVTDMALVPYGKGKLRNYTELADDEVQKIMEQGLNIRLEQTDTPQVLLFHTHATESYEPYDSAVYDTRNSWRSTDNSHNMVAVGEVLAQTLRDAGIGVIHDTTQHDYPSYSGSYERSAETIKRYLAEYPTIKVVLDIHRDGIQRESDVIVKPTVEINGKKAAQLMMITGSEDGTMNVPRWRENLRFAASLQDAIEQDFPQLTRPIFFCYRKYNMDLTTGSLLFEVGSNGNTLEESKYTAELVGKSLARLLLGSLPKENPTPTQ